MDVKYAKTNKFVINAYQASILMQQLINVYNSVIAALAHSLIKQIALVNNALINAQNALAINLINARLVIEDSSYIQ